MKNGDGLPGKNLNGWISLHHQEMENDLLENSHPKFGGVFFQLSCGWEGWETQFVAPQFPSAPSPIALPRFQALRDVTNLGTLLGHGIAQNMF